jgi:hypothetical protein
MSAEMLTQIKNETVKHIGDATSIGIVVGTLMEWLPAIAAIVTIIWTGIRIYETETVQKFLRKKKGHGKP